MQDIHTKAIFNLFMLRDTEQQLEETFSQNVGPDLYFHLKKYAFRFICRRLHYTAGLP